MAFATTWTGNRLATSSFSSQDGSTNAPRSDAVNDRTHRKPQTRQLLSCTKCRERKVKCDRTKPCSACCARGHPKECEFVVGEGNDYSPIQQSYEIRKLRLENQRLKERLQSARLSHSEDEGEADGRDQSSVKGTNRASTARQRRFKTGDRTDNLYFGTPGLASMVSDLASMRVGGQSLAHPMPRLAPQEIFAPNPSIYPFHNLWSEQTGIKSLVDMLPPRDEIFTCLEMFERRAQSCSFPHTPAEVNRREVERFLLDVYNNAERHPDMLALVFVTIATGLQMGQYDASGGMWAAGAVEETTKKTDVFVAASMQALRLASFLNQPTLLAIQTLIMMGPYLTNSGRFLDAFTLFGMTIRMAHSIGLHRNPKCLDPTPPLRECMVRQTIWWWMLHMDQQYSVTLGRPLGISGFGDCPPPEALTTNPTLLRLGEFVHHFTILARQILASDGMMSPMRVDEYTDKLVGLWDTMPEALQFNESWIHEATSLPEWPLEVASANLFASVQSFLILLNRQRIESAQNDVREPPMTQPAVPTTALRPPDMLDHPPHAAPLRGRALVINSSIHLIQTFMFFHYRNPAVLISWSIGQQAFNACMILIYDAWETENEQNEWLVNQAFAVFSVLHSKGVHKMASLAVRRISEGLAQLGHRRAEREQQSMAQHQSPERGDSPTLTLDTAGMAGWGGDEVMGNTGSFLLEDTGLQAFTPAPFTPLAWHIAPDNASQGLSQADGANNSSFSGSQDTFPVYQVHAAPFPVMSSPPLSAPTMAHSSSFTSDSRHRATRGPARKTFSRSRQPQRASGRQQSFNGVTSGDVNDHKTAAYGPAEDQRHGEFGQGSYVYSTTANPALLGYMGQHDARGGVGFGGFHENMDLQGTDRFEVQDAFRHLIALRKT